MCCSTSQAGNVFDEYELFEVSVLEYAAVCARVTRAHNRNDVMKQRWSGKEQCVHVHVHVCMRACMYMRVCLSVCVPPHRLTAHACCAVQARAIDG